MTEVLSRWYFLALAGMVVFFAVVCVVLLAVFGRIQQHPAEPSEQSQDITGAEVVPFPRGLGDLPAGVITGLPSRWPAAVPAGPL